MILSCLWIYLMFVDVMFVCSWSVFLFGQSKIARDSDPLKFEEEDLILKVGECLEARSLSLLNFFPFF